MVPTLCSYVAYFSNPLIKDYLQFFDTPAPVHRITPFPRHEKEMEKEKGGEKHYLSVGD